MTKWIVSGKTVEEAIEQGLQQLNVSRDRVRVHILEQPNKGLFGIIGAKDAKVELEIIPDAIETVLVFMKDMFAAMGVDVSIERRDLDEYVKLELQGKELGLLIGRRGQTLDALQYLVNVVASRHTKNHKRIILDAENFRERRKHTLEQLAVRLADKVVRTGKEVVLEPMSPLERKIIHTRLQDYPGVQTHSEGEEPNRRVVITLQ